MKSKPLNPDEAAAALGVHRGTVLRWIRSGALAAAVEGKRIEIDPAAVEAFFRTCSNCGKRFVSSHPTTRIDYCSEPCRWTLRNAARKTGRPPGRPALPRTAPDPAAVPDRLKAAAEWINRKKSR
jgi:excisionase family DNA binding protein